LTAISRLVLFGALWLALAGADPASLWFGLPAAAAATALSLRLYPASRPGLRIHRAVLFAPSLLARGLLGGLDVARRALDPRLPVSPGWIKLHTEGGTTEFRILLGGVISVLPGTLAAAPSCSTLDVHVLQSEGFDSASLRAEEGRIGRLLTPERHAATPQAGQDG